MTAIHFAGTSVQGSGPLPPKDDGSGRGSLNWLFGPDRSAGLRRQLCLVLGPALVLAWMIRFDFVFDDPLVILEDPLVLSGAPLRDFLTTPVRVGAIPMPNYRPLIALLYRTDWILWGANPAGYHFTNLLWHLLATILVYRIGLRTTRRVAAAWIGALLFALHPVHTEAIGCIQGRVDPVSTRLLLLALLALLRVREAAGWASWRWATLAGLAFLAALLAKESVAALPLPGRCGRTPHSGSTGPASRWRAWSPGSCHISLLAFSIGCSGVGQWANWLASS